MSIVELPDTGGPGSLVRTPPQDLAAEQSVLGGMLLSKDAIADVVEVLRGPDFYRPAHELVYEAILDLYGRGEPADAVTVAAELVKRGEMGRVGGAPYLHNLLQSVPTAANAGYYARIVRETAILRRLIEAGTKIVQLGYAGDGDADDIVDAAQAEVYGVTDKRTSEDYLPLSAIMEGALDEIEAIGSRGGEMVGVPTGFADFDELTNGLHPGQMIVVAARPAVGKALALDTPLPTPTGWTTMGEVAVGDLLLGADGRPTRVVAATDVMRGRPCFEVELSDGAVVVADAEHQWCTTTVAGSTAVRTTRELAATLWAETGAGRGSRGEDAGSTTPCRGRRRSPSRRRTCRSRRTSSGPGSAPAAATRPATGSRRRRRRRRRHGDADADEIAMYVESEVDPAAVDDSAAALVGSGPAGAGRLPAGRRGPAARAAGRRPRPARAGHPSGCVQVPGLPAGLAGDLRELVVSLGYECGLSTSAAPASTALPRAADLGDDRVLQRAGRVPGGGQAPRAQGAARGAPETGSGRAVVDVRRVPSVPVRCVEVDSDDHLYLAGPTMVATHNSTLGLDIARAAAIKHNMTTCVFSLEMSRNEITMRLLSAEARVALHHMRTGKLTDDDWTRLARRMGEVSNAPLFIDDSPNMSMMEIRAKCRRLKQRNDLKLVIIDYLQLMQSGKRVESRQQEVSEFSRALKLLAKELEVPVIAISQLNRGPEQRTDKKPQMSDLRESGCLPASTRVVRADTGAEVTMGELFASGARDVPVWSLDDSLRYRRADDDPRLLDRRSEVFRITMASGKTVRATANHPLLTYDGWRPLGEPAGSDPAVPAT